MSIISHESVNPSGLSKVFNFCWILQIAEESRVALSVGPAQPVIGEGRGHRPRERRERSRDDVTLAQASPATDSVITLIPLISQIAIVVVKVSGYF